MSKRIYLAGPEVFLRQAKEMGRRKREICARYDFEGVYPLDADLDLTGLRPREAGLSISRENERLIEGCQVLIANMTPFRGPSINVGTAFEMGFMRALKRPVLAYTNSKVLFTERTQRFLQGTLKERPEGGLEDSDGLLLEDFGLVDNLMLDGAVRASGSKIVLHAASPEALYTDLRGFTRCVEEARRLMEE